VYDLGISGQGIPGARLEVLTQGGRFLPLDCPQQLVDLVTQFAVPS
jgi:hypothetical protein